MANEKENNELSLSELGLKSEDTPAAQIAAKKEEAAKKIITTDQGVKVEVNKVDMSKIKEDDEPKEKKRKIPRPVPREDNGDPSEHKFNIIKDVNQIATIKTHAKTYVDPAVAKLKEYSDLADKGIARTEAQMTAPNGRIKEGKEKYILARYETLTERAKSSKNLNKKIEFYKKAMASDPRFDDINEYEYKGYILYKVAHDDSIGITDKSFGLAQEAFRGARKSSADINKQMKNIVEEAPDMDDDDSTIVLGTTDKNKLPKKEDIPEFNLEPADTSPVVVPDLPPVGEAQEEIPLIEPDEVQEPDDPKPTTPTPTVEVGESVPDEISDLLAPEDSAEAEAIRENNAQISEQTEVMEKFGVSSQELTEIAENYYKEASAMLGIADMTEIDAMFGDSSNGDDIGLNAALRIYLNQHPEARNPVRTIWPLMCTGKPIVSTALSGQEFSQFLDDISTGLFEGEQFKEEPDIEKLRSIFTALYKHYVNQGGVSFSSWLKTIAAPDMTDLIFSQYNALFSHNNFMSYQCRKKGCVKLYLEKKKVMDMIVFNDDDCKKRFASICKKEAIGSDLYHTPPIMINDTFAFSFSTPSIYSMYFERSSLSEHDRKKFSSVVNLLPAIHSVYLLDHRNKTRNRINFGVDPKSLENTTMRKVNGLMRILITFDTDQRAKLLSEYIKVIRAMDKNYLTYQIPASKCPSCGSIIEAEPINPFSALFTRAHLSTEVASSRVFL